MAGSKEGHHNTLQALSDAMSRWDLKSNWKKTTMMDDTVEAHSCVDNSEIHL